jgi:hypothetical protein
MFLDIADIFPALKKFISLLIQQVSFLPITAGSFLFSTAGILPAPYDRFHTAAGLFHDQE